MSGTFEVAHTNEQGVDFLVVLVKSRVLSSSSDQEDLNAFFRSEYGPIPVVFATQRSKGQVEYRGRPDIVRFLSNIYFEQLPWERVTFSTAA